MKKELPDWITKDDIKGLADQVPPATQHGYSAHFWAEKAGMQSAYNTLYRHLNVFSHGSIVGLDAYLKVDSNGVATGIRGRALSEHGPQYLITAASMMANIIAGLGDADGMALTFARELGALQSEINSIS